MPKNMAISTDDSQNTQTKNGAPVDYKATYKNLKRRFFMLIQENECFQSELRKIQGEYLQVTRDNEFLLERLMQYENYEDAETDTEATDSSDDEPTVKSEAHVTSRKKKAAKDDADKEGTKKKKHSGKNQAQNKTAEIINTIVPSFTLASHIDPPTLRIEESPVPILASMAKTQNIFTVASSSPKTTESSMKLHK